MPPADLDLDLLPGLLKEAATAAINVDGYHQPAVEVTPRKAIRNLTPEQKAVIRERLRRGQAAKAANTTPRAPAIG